MKVILFWGKSQVTYPGFPSRLPGLGDNLFTNEDTMNLTIAIDICRKAVQTILMCAAPMLLVGMAIGLIISIFQAATQINEQTLTFVPKIVAVFLTLLFFGPWLIRILTTFTHGIIDMIATM